MTIDRNKQKLSHEENIENEKSRIVFNQRSLLMPKSIIATAIGTSITIATAGTIVSILAGAVTIVYTSMKIIDWIQMRRLKKLRRQMQIKRLEDSG